MNDATDLRPVRVQVLSIRRIKKQTYLDGVMTLPARPGLAPFSGVNLTKYFQERDNVPALGNLQQHPLFFFMRSRTTW